MSPRSDTLLVVRRSDLVRVVVLAALLSTLLAILAPPAPLASADASDSCQSSSRRRARRARSRRRRGPRVTPAERRAIRRRHTKAPRAAIERWLEESPPPLVLRPVNGGGEFILTPETDAGGFGDDDLLAARTALASREDGSTHDIHPRLLDLVYQAARHFRAPWVFVVSGYRSGRATSRHAHGRAMDFVLPGTSDRRLAAWLRGLGFVGVGIYPTSGFVHLDVRERSYFWSDSSGPREDNRERPILRDTWARADREARADGIEPTSDDAIRAAREAERAGTSREGGEGGEGESESESDVGEGGESAVAAESDDEPAPSAGSSEESVDAGPAEPDAGVTVSGSPPSP